MSQALPAGPSTGGAPRDEDDDAVRRRILDVITARALRPVFQPIVHLDTGIMVGAEALARFPSAPEPGTWFAEAARVGLGPALELAAAHAATAHIDRLPHGAYLSLNASVTTTAVPAFADLIRSVHPDRVVVELTFRTGGVTLDDIVGAVERVVDLGARVALDDVGGALLAVHDVVGVSPDIVKLDRDIVRGLTDPAVRVIATGVVGAAQALGAFTIAKGVETGEQLAAVTDLGVDAAQGNLLGAPTPVEEAFAADAA
jgi:EAL domain-containing protein (putative c-di-GMP-specific phosphodiesterase class I)